MAIQYDISPFAVYTDGETLTEAEHQDSCDINKMIKAALRGQSIRGGHEPIYGFDDTTMDAVQFRIQKADLESQLHQLSQEVDLTPQELSLIPERIQKLFQFRTKTKTTSTANTTNELNDKITGQHQASTPVPPNPPVLT